MAAGRLQGKEIIITAAAQGIGRAVAKAFAEEGANVLATDINAEKLAELDAIKGIRTKVLDVTDSDAIKALAKELCGIGSYWNDPRVRGERYVCVQSSPGIRTVSNALDPLHEKLPLITFDVYQEWDFLFDVNVKSMYRMTKQFLPIMLSQGSGVVINMASVTSSVMGVPNRFAYAATKGAVIGFTKALAADFAAQGIRVYAICPATVMTPSLQEQIDDAPDPEEALKMYVSRQKQGRLGKPEEIAKLAVFLASDEAPYMTGCEHIIDGGWLLD